ncbi:MAG: hypothetical protein ACHQ1H_13045, partial [Nitrososphaerales archaeon]
VSGFIPGVFEDNSDPEKVLVVFPITRAVYREFKVLRKNGFYRGLTFERAAAASAEKFFARRGIYVRNEGYSESLSTGKVSQKIEISYGKKMKLLLHGILPSPQDPRKWTPDKVGVYTEDAGDDTLFVISRVDFCWHGVFKLWAKDRGYESGFEDFVAQAFEEDLYYAGGNI